MRLVCLPTILLSLSLSGQTRLAYDPFVKGASADVEIAVSDEGGVAVGGAEVTVWFEVSSVKSEKRTGTTAADGIFAASLDTCTGGVIVNVKKDGYYGTSVREFIRRQTEDAVVRTRKWSPGPVRLTVMLRKIRNPAKLVRNWGLDRLAYPATNVVMGFDLERRDWCPPYGKGKYEDWQVCYRFSRSPSEWGTFHEHVVITMTNGLDGVCFCPVESFSDFKYAYHADTNATYAKRVEVELDRTYAKILKRVCLPEGRFIVFRTRTRVDDNGRLVSAHYGYVPEPFHTRLFFDISTMFNPNENDTNLESIPDSRNRTKKGRR